MDLNPTKLLLSFSINSHQSVKSREMTPEQKFLQKAPNPIPSLNSKSSFSVSDLKLKKKSADGIGSFIAATPAAHYSTENQITSALSIRTDEPVMLSKDYPNKRSNSAFFSDHNLIKSNEFQMKSGILTTDSSEQVQSVKHVKSRSFRITTSTEFSEMQKKSVAASLLLSGASTTRADLHRRVISDSTLEKGDNHKAITPGQQQIGHFSSFRITSGKTTSKVICRMERRYSEDITSLQSLSSTKTDFLSTKNNYSSNTKLDVSGTSGETQKPLLHLRQKSQEDPLIIKEEPESPELAHKKVDNSKPSLKFTMPGYQPAKCSTLGNGAVKAYATATNAGTTRKYNEDRVSVILSISPPQERENESWPKSSYFAVYDGHGGSKCADFLKDHLHEFVTLAI